MVMRLMIHIEVKVMIVQIIFFCLQEKITLIQP